MLLSCSECAPTCACSPTPPASAQFVYNLTTRAVAYINHSYADTAVVEKNWVPFYYDGDLFFLTSVKPLRLIGPCRASESSPPMHTISCADFYTEADSFATQISNDERLVRGGTQLIEHSHGFYYGLGHTKHKPHKGARGIVEYRPALMVLSMLGTPKLVIHSHPLQVFGPGDDARFCCLHSLHTNRCR